VSPQSVRLFVVLNTTGTTTIGVKVDSVPPWERVRRRARAHEEGALENGVTTSRPPSSLDDALQHAANRGGSPSHDDDLPFFLLVITWPPPLLLFFFKKKEKKKRVEKTPVFKATRVWVVF